MAVKWKERIQKCLLWTPAPWLVAAVSVTAAAILLVPLIRLAFYAIPWYDDYNWGNYIKDFLEQEHSLSSALQGAAYCVRTEWYAWQGPYTANFFSAIMPAVWGEKYYFLGPLFIILFLPAAVWILAGTLMKNVLRTTDKASCTIVQSVAAAAAVVLLYSPREGFYWYIGGMCYVGLHSFLMLLVAGWIRLLTVERKISSIALLIWTLAGAALAAGSTYVTALQGLLIGLSIMTLGLLLRNKRFLLLLPSMVVYTYGFYISVSAPGNSVRKAQLEEMGIGMEALPAVSGSFIEAFRQTGEFTDMALIAMLILLLPVVWNMVRKIEFPFRYPGLLLLWSFCFYATGFTPCLYSLGSIGPERALNVTKLTYQVLLFINVVYWLGWFYRKLEQAQGFPLFGWRWEKRGKLSANNPPLLFYLAVGMFVFGIVFINPDRIHSYSSCGAYYAIHSGEAYNFYQEYLERVEMIKNSGDDVAVKPYSYAPEMLCVGELTEDMYSGPNRAIAKWYGKNSVVLDRK